MSKERLEAFSDGVIAILITIIPFMLLNSRMLPPHFVKTTSDRDRPTVRHHPGI